MWITLHGTDTLVLIFPSFSPEIHFQLKNCWKISGDKHILKNCRPVPLLPIAGKIFEKYFLKKTIFEKKIRFNNNFKLWVLSYAFYKHIPNKVIVLRNAVITLLKILSIFIFYCFVYFIFASLQCIFAFH